MDILELKVGNVDTSKIDEYNMLQNKLTFWRKRLTCVTGSHFNCEYFKLGDYSSSCSYENDHYMILATNRSKDDVKLKQEVIDFLTCRIIDNINETIKRINELVK